MKTYYLSTMIQTTMQDARARVVTELQKEGFGVLTETDVAAMLKKKLNVDFRDYVILGVCNPHYAYQALQQEDKIGTLLPCSVVIQEIPSVGTEVAVVDPVGSMQAVDNPEIAKIAGEVREKLKAALARLA